MLGRNNLYLIFFLLFTGANSQDKICNGREVESTHCYEVSSQPMRWSDAYRFCHRRGGWLNNCVQCSDGAFPSSDVALLSANGVVSLWSGNHVKDRRLLADNFPVPRRLGLFNMTTWYHNNTELELVDSCVVQIYEGPRCESDPSKEEGSGFIEQPQRKKRQVRINQELCYESYARQFVDCEEMHHFICMFESESVYILPQDDEVVEAEVFTLSTNPYQFYFSTIGVNYTKVDEACNMTFPTGMAFRVDSEADEIFLKLVTWSRVWRQDNRQDYSDFEDELLWIRGDHGACTAVRLELSDVPQPTVLNWPCETELTVICSRPIVYSEPQIPEMVAAVRGAEIAQVRDEIQVTARAMRAIGGLGWPEESNDPPPSLRLECRFYASDRVRGVTIFKSGSPFLYYSDSMFAEEPFSLRQRRIPVDFFVDPSSYQAMDSMQYYYCEKIDKTTRHKLVSSQRIFIRLSDYDVYSVHLPLLNSNMTKMLAWVWSKASLTETWPSQRQVSLEPDFVESPTLSTNSLSRAKRAVSDSILASTFSPEELAMFDSFQSRLGTHFAEMGWRIKPLTLLERNEGQELVTYIYKEAPPGVNVLNRNRKPDNLVLLREASRSIRSAFQSEATRFSELDVGSVTVMSIDWCWTVRRMDNVTNLNFTLPTSPEGTVWQSPQRCAQDDRPLITVTCEGDKFVGLMWGPTMVNRLCDYSSLNGTETDVTATLQKLAQENITSTTVVDTITSTKNLTTDSLGPRDVSYVSDIIQKSLDTDEDLPPETVQDILDTITVVSSLPDPVLEDAQQGAKATNRLLQSMDRLGQRLRANRTTRTISQRFVSGGLALEVWNLAPDYNNTQIVGLMLLEDGRIKEIRPEDLISLFSSTHLDFERADVAVLLPEQFIQSVVASSPGADVRLAVNVYKDTNLYERSSTHLSAQNRTLNSKVIAGQVLVDDQPIEDLGQFQVQTVFLPNQRLPEELRPGLTSCVFWDFSARQGAGGWSSDGCHYQKSQEGRDICVCDHLTNFAVLLSFYDQESLDNDHQLALSIITIVGLSLSIAGLALSILSFLLIQKLRQGRPQQTLFHLSLALMMAWIVFLVGINETSSHAGCIVVAALLHYLILASFMWMLMEGILQYLLFVRVMNTYFTNYMLKTAIPAWGLPIIPVAIILAIDTELYKGGRDYCWMKLDAFYYGFALPVGLIIFTNIIIFILVVVSLCRRKDMSSHSSQSKNQTVVNVRASFICFCVLGLSWIFGFLAIDDARLVFQYLFCITASLQGFIIFIMMTARDQKVRQYWKSVCCCRNKEAAYSSTGNGTNTQNAVRIPRVQSNHSKSQHSNSTSYTSDGRNSVDSGVMPPQVHPQPHNRKSYGQREQVLF